MSSSKDLTHVNARGEAHIVDIGEKQATHRRAVAQAIITAAPETISALFNNSLKKGDALSTARIAGIMAAKKTSELIPLCHPIALTHVEILIDQIDEKRLQINASAQTTDKTGVEMEAFTAATVAALTIYDMAKAIDRGMEISQIVLLEKSGGKSGTYRRGT
jgi:cyclic pyranopterin phosphate synthase